MISEGRIVTDGAECFSICSVGLIVKNGSLLLVFGLGNNLGTRATYSGISLVSWLEWKDSERHSHETTHKTRTQTWTLVLYNWNRSPYYTHTHTHTLERISQLFVSRCVDLQTVASFSHFSQHLCEELWDEDINIRFMSLQVHHIKYFACTKLQV